MEIKELHGWDALPAEARVIQAELAKRVRLENDFGPIRTIAGADICFDEDEAIAGVVVFSYPELEVMEKVSARLEVKYPYIPGCSLMEA